MWRPPSSPTVHLLHLIEEVTKAQREKPYLTGSTRPLLALEGPGSFTLPHFQVKWEAEFTRVLRKITSSPDVGDWGIRNQKFGVKIQKSSCTANFPSHLATPFDAIVC